MNITLKELLCFQKIIETGSFSEAAVELSLSQPTLSSHISSLERKLKTKLLERSKKGISVNKAGRILFNTSKKISTALKESENEINRLKNIKAGKLTIGASTIPGTCIVPAKISKFIRIFPLVEIELIIGDSAEIITKIQENTIDVGFSGCPPEKAIFHKKIENDEIILCANKTHKWAEKNTVSLTELLEEPLIMREAGSGTRKIFLDKIHKKTRKKLKTSLIVSSSEAMKNFILSGSGIGVISKKAVIKELKSKTLKEIRIKGLTFTRPFYLLLKHETPECGICKEFIKLF